MDFELAGTVILSGLLIVFLVLVLLTTLVWAFGKIMVSISGGEKKGSKTTSAPAPKAAPAPIVAPAPAAQVIEEGISEELVAVISASIAAMLGTGENFVVKSVKRSAATKVGRSAWGMAGMQQNTSPF